MIFIVDIFLVGKKVECFMVDEFDQNFINQKVFIDWWIADYDF